ncbi:hypothetical protein K490DRAFT_66545 [Saccharata proteae CBS 121410]|uniref:Uncharacterized protein n=1 Tax=Saccharata proteae CBS 121410 TaxID=1314787 RepID=A0A9P4HU36_9PEZI|nr:hypothetical protein K490DRAFT_66545 [Saccharata proteae CBS 121410]
MTSPLLEPIKPTEDEPPPQQALSSKTPTGNPGALHVHAEHGPTVLTKHVSEGTNILDCAEEENPETEIRWPVRRFSASSDPVTKARRMRRLETIIQKAKQHGHRHRTLVDSPAEENETADNNAELVPSPVRRLSSHSGGPRFLWYHSTGDIFRRAKDAAHATSRHIRSRSRPVTGAEMPVSSVEEAPAPGLHRTQTDPTTAEIAGESSLEQDSRRREHCLPSLHLWVHRTDSNSPPVTSAHLESSPSLSSNGSRSAKSARADTAVTLADVHVWSAASHFEPEDESSSLAWEGRRSTTPSTQFVESSYGAYEVVWDDTTSPILEDEVYDAADESDEVLPPQRLPRSSSWAFGNSSKDNLDPSPRRDQAELTRSRSHPRFRPYVEVYQDEEPTFDLDDDGLTMAAAPPNSKRASFQNFHRPTRQSSEDSPDLSPSLSSSSEVSVAPEDEAFPHSHSSQLEVPEPPRRPDSPRPHNSSDGLNLRYRNLSNLPEESASLTRNHRDSYQLTRERYLDYPEANSPYLHDAPYLHRDSVAIARDRLRKKHGQSATTAPIDVPRMQQQISFVGGLSPIPDFSPRSQSEPPNIAGMTRSSSMTAGT